MKKLIGIIVCLMIFGCADQDVKDVQEKEHNGTSYETMLAEYKYSTGTEWSKTGDKIQAVSGIEVSDDTKIEQALVFDADGNIEKIVWDKNGDEIVIEAQRTIDRILAAIKKNESVLDVNVDSIRDMIGDLF